MGLRQRVALLFRARANRALDHLEDPGDALELAYEKQLQALQRVRRGVADVVTSQKQLEIQQRQMEANSARLDDLARRALEQGREELAASALTQGELVQGQMHGLRAQMDALSQQRENLEMAGQRLQTRIASMRTQKQTLKAQYSAARATVHAGETVAGISKDMDDIELLLERARDKMLSTQARAEAVNELLDTGVLGRLGAGGVEALESQVRTAAIAQSVDQRLEAMKQELGMGGGASPARLEAPPTEETRTPKRSRARKS